MTTYSILKRIVAFATRSIYRRISAFNCLTVSSNGSSPLQQISFLKIKASGYTSYSILKRIVASATFPRMVYPSDVLDLQYPQTDRRLCNLSKDQVYPSDVLDLQILKRIVASATFPRMVYPSDVLDLQYPQTDRRLCNLSKDGLSQ